MIANKTRALPRDAHSRMRLEAALSLQEKARTIEAKPLRRRLDETAFYPAHDKRQESAEYKAAHHHLVVELDLPCRVCGVKNSTLKVNREHPYGASAMETHHCMIEWALANAVDAGKFNKVLLPHLRAQHPGNALYRKKALSKREIVGAIASAAVDHDVGPVTRGARVEVAVRRRASDQENSRSKEPRESTEG